MFKKVHLILGLFLALYFLPAVNDKIVFFPVVILASLIPDLDAVLFPGRNYRVLEPLKNQNYRDFMHSYTICVLLAVIIAIFVPVLALPFFIGYSSHLFFDSLTVAGIIPFWPLRTRVSGFIRPDGKVEKSVEVILAIFILVFILRYLIG